VTTFYSLRFESPPAWWEKSPYLCPPGAEWPAYIPVQWVPFSSPPTTLRATVEGFEPAYMRGQPQLRGPGFHYRVFSRYRGNIVSTEVFPSNGRCTVTCLLSCYLAMGLCVTILMDGKGKERNVIFSLLSPRLGHVSLACKAGCSHGCEVAT
jgi:hypothetical protein